MPSRIPAGFRTVAFFASIPDFFSCSLCLLIESLACPWQPTMQHFASIVLILVDSLSVYVGATTYYPNGKTPSRDIYQPCNSLDGASMACASTDDCLRNGLCKVVLSPGVTNSSVEYWRDTCSISDWTNPRCLNNRCAVCSYPSFLSKYTWQNLHI